MNLDSFKNKTVLITGATGLIGSHIVDKLLTVDGTTVLALGRSMAKLSSTFSDNSSRGKLMCVEHDISKPIPEKFGAVDFIFHAASPISGEIIKTRPLDVIDSNLSGTINCLEYLRNQGHGKMIVFSSATVYSVDVPNHVAYETETSIADSIDAPNAPYSESKRMVEVIANAYHKQHLVDVLVVRFSYVYGYSKHPAKTAFYEFINKALAGENIVMNKSGLSRRDNIFVEDAVDGLLHLCNKGKVGEVYNISSDGDMGNYAAVDEMAELIAKNANKLISDSHVKVTFKEQGQERKEGLRLSNKKIKATGWAISTSIEDGIYKTMKEYLKK